MAWNFIVLFLPFLFLRHSIADLSPTHTIICEGPLPPILYTIELDPVQLQRYGPDAHNFCRVYARIGFSLGCHCNMTNQVECTEERASGMGELMVRHPVIRQHCLDHCSCIKKEDMPWEDQLERLMLKGAIEEEAAQRQRDYIASRRGKPFRAGRHRQSSSSGSSGSGGRGSGNQRAAYQADWHSNIPLLESQCAASCTSMAQCSSLVGLDPLSIGPAGSEGCKCKGSVIPGTRSWTSYCAMDWASLMGKRDLFADPTSPATTMPRAAVEACPCNATYISEGCCGSVDGLLWEAPELNLGIVAMGDD